MKGGSLETCTAREANMLSRKRCPHTGVVNFFHHAEPHLAIGSVLKAEGSSGYQWLYYTDPCAATGTAPDLKTAERLVAELYRSTAGNQDTSIGHAA
jgi:hypothetical protein